MYLVLSEPGTVIQIDSLSFFHYCFLGGKSEQKQTKKSHGQRKEHLLRAKFPGISL